MLCMFMNKKIIYVVVLTITPEIEGRAVGGAGVGEINIVFGN